MSLSNLYSKRPQQLIEGGSKTCMELESNQMFDPNSNCKVKEAQIFLDVKIWSNPTIFRYWIKFDFFLLKILWVPQNFTKDNEIWHNYTGSLDGTKACHGRQFNPDSREAQNCSAKETQESLRKNEHGDCSGIAFERWANLLWLKCFSKEFESNQDHFNVSLAQIRMLDIFTFCFKLKLIFWGSLNSTEMRKKCTKSFCWQCLEYQP